MVRLLIFLSRIYRSLLFLALEITAIALYASSTPYTVARVTAFSARLHDATGAVSRSVHRIGEAAAVRRQNSDYALRIAELENRLTAESPADTVRSEVRDGYTYIAAHVVASTVVRPENTITIDRGYADGVVEESALVTPDGAAVGIVVRCSEHFSVAKSLLNTSLRISGRLARDQSIGSVHWTGGDTAMAWFEDVSQYASVNIGDEVVAAGFSHFFPDGTAVGVIDGMERVEGRTVFSCRLRLHADFPRLRDVLVVHNVYKEEQDILEQR